MKRFLSVVMILCISMSVMGCAEPASKSYAASSDLAKLSYKGKIVKVNKNKPNFSKKQKKSTKLKVKYSKLDSLGRCGKVYAVLGKKNMPSGKRGSIGMYRPSGWPKRVADAKYDFVPGKYVYNRSHLLGWQLRGDSTNNEKNLITGTRQLNADSKLGMLPYENKVAKYLKKSSKNRVVYRVTPIFKGKELVARGVEMEAYSVGDKGKAICFHIYIHNVQPGVKIDYKTGKTTPTKGTTNTEEEKKETGKTIFYLNIKTGKFHTKSCRYATGDNIEQTNLTARQLKKDGYEACKVCNPSD